MKLYIYIRVKRSNPILVLVAIFLLAPGSCSRPEGRPDESNLIKDSEIIRAATPGKWVCDSDESIELHFSDDYNCEIKNIPLRKGGIFTGNGKYTIESYGPKRSPSIIIIADDAPSAVVLTTFRTGSDKMQIRYTISANRHSYLWFSRVEGQITR